MCTYRHVCVHTHTSRLSLCIHCEYIHVYIQTCMCTHKPIDSVSVYIMHISSYILAHIHTYIHIHKRFKKNRTDLKSHRLLTHSPVITETFGGLLMQEAMAAAHQDSKKLQLKVQAQH